VGSHSATESLLRHHSDLASDGTFSRADEWIDVSDEPSHDELCRREQEVFLRAIREDLDLTAHLQSAIDSLRVVIAADQSAIEGRTIDL
jgi:predicted dehydrogenase